MFTAKVRVAHLKDLLIINWSNFVSYFRKCNSYKKIDYDS